MKQKYFIRGVGVGILVCTMILVTVYLVEYKAKLSDDEVIRRAEELGMVTTESPLANLEKPTEASSDEITTTELVKPTETEATSEEVTEATTTETTTEEATTEAATEASTEKPAGTKKITFTVVSGMNSYNVAKILADQGAVDNADKFDQYLVSNGYANRISTGEYTVEVGEDYETIARRLAGGN